jgi:hypothetical protein
VEKYGKPGLVRRAEVDEYLGHRAQLTSRQGAAGTIAHWLRETATALPSDTSPLTLGCHGRRQGDRCTRAVAP